jgi:hypothetical protein
LTLILRAPFPPACSAFRSLQFPARIPNENVHDWLHLLSAIKMQSDTLHSGIAFTAAGWLRKIRKKRQNKACELTTTVVPLSRCLRFRELAELGGLNSWSAAGSGLTRNGETLYCIQQVKSRTLAKLPAYLEGLSRREAPPAREVCQATNQVDFAVPSGWTEEHAMGMTARSRCLTCQLEGRKRGGRIWKRWCRVTVAPLFGCVHFPVVFVIAHLNWPARMRYASTRNSLNNPLSAQS